ncbi:MFS transporter, partial [Streptococcus suis]
LSTTALFVWLTLLSVLQRIALSMFNLPYQAVGAELSDDYNERSSIMAWRWGLAVTGTLSVVALGFGVFFNGPGAQMLRGHYTPFALTLAGIL